jgi:hypothetical protein
LTACGGFCGDGLSGPGEECDGADLGRPLTELDRLVRAAGLEKRRRRSVGFGPFTFLGVRLLSDSRSVALHRRLQRLADRGVPILRAAGMNAMVLATKPVTAGDRR